MPIFIWIILSTLIVSLLSLAGIFTLLFKKRQLEQWLLLLVGFAGGALMGGAFLHLLPESLEHLSAPNAFLFTLIGFLLFFLMERVLYWRHCHEGVCDIHTFTYLNLFGDATHNFVDGLVIAGSFLAGIPTGIITTLVVALHEIPQEIGDFGVLVYGGFSISRALFYNLLVSLTAIAGGILGYFLSEQIAGFSAYLLPLTAGGFIYIAAADLIPELHKEKNSLRANLAFIAFILGIAFIWLFKFLQH